MSEITTSVHDCMCVRLYTSEMNNSVSYIYLPRNAVSFASMKIFTGKASCRHTHDYHMHMEHYIDTKVQHPRRRAHGRAKELLRVREALSSRKRTR